MCSFAHICRHFLGKIHVPYKSLPDHWTSPLNMICFWQFSPILAQIRGKKPTGSPETWGHIQMNSSMSSVTRAWVLSQHARCEMQLSPTKRHRVKTDAFTQHKSHFIRTVCFHHDIIQPDSGYYQIRTRLQHKANNGVNMSPHARYSWLWPSLCVEYCPEPWLKPSLLLKQILQYIIFVLTS